MKDRESRRGVDFSKHEHTVEIFKSDKNEIRVDHFRVGSSNMRYIKFINTDNTLTISGDYGKWVFCRAFHPSAEGFVSDGYWREKLSQESMEYDSEATAEEIQEQIDGGLAEYGYEGEELEKCIEWYKELLEQTDDEFEYTYKLYRDYDKPDCLDYEDLPFCKKQIVWLSIIFDAFDEMCRRMKVEEENLVAK